MQKDINDKLEQIDFILNWISSTLTFWDYDKTFPANLMKYSAEECIKILKSIDKDIL